MLFNQVGSIEMKDILLKGDLDQKTSLGLPKNMFSREFCGRIAARKYQRVHGDIPEG